MSTIGEILRSFYEALLRAYGPQGWWPGRTRTEIVVGAILTQNTNWANVEKAIARLDAEGLLDWAALRDVSTPRLAECIRPAGYYNIKAARLKNFVIWLWEEHGGDFDGLRDRDLGGLREELLSIRGIGRETADSILLYALDKPTFVVDAYTARILGRHRLIDEAATYEEIKSIFEDVLPADVPLFNEFHALLVAVGKRHCRPQARCEGCPLAEFPHEPA